MEFTDATVWEPEPGDTLYHIRRMEEVWYAADRARMLGSTLGPMSPEERRELISSTAQADRRVETIVSPDMFKKGLELAEEMELTKFAREMLESGQGRSFVYDGPIPLILVIADETVMLAPTDENGIPTAVVVTENEAIRSWVETTLDEYRDQSTELTADDLPIADTGDD
ncbi:hypothetical protein [Haloferax sp. DFSO52]|uniref:transcriptional regulator FilR1 domain-containing protein n=1 Tax=Haloferax sp. DFSO52 TaxID=3388505 RepID=UPI003A89AF2B